MNTISLPKDFPMDKMPSEGAPRKFLVEATFDGKSGDSYEFIITKVDGVDVESSDKDEPLEQDDETAEPEHGDKKGGAMAIIMGSPKPGEESDSMEEMP